MRFLKVIIDFLTAAVGLVSLASLFFIIAVLIKLDSKGPIFFKQKRVGQNGKIFTMWKFRTMVEGAGEKEKELSSSEEELSSFSSEHDPRITKVGRFLRIWTLDEWPQLINVLKGEMSLVGPRPLPQYRIEKYNVDKKRLSVKPGMVSLVDIKGRNLVSWNKRFEYDIWYIENWSLLLDLKILFLTPFVVLSRKGVYSRSSQKRRS